MLQLCYIYMGTVVKRIHDSIWDAIVEAAKATGKPFAQVTIEDIIAIKKGIKIENKKETSDISEEIKEIKNTLKDILAEIEYIKEILGVKEGKIIKKR